MEMSTIKNLEYYIWLELNNGEWPDILFDIKPSNWDSLDFGSKGELVLANYAKICCQVTALNCRLFNYASAASSQKFQPQEQLEANHLI